MDVRIKFLFFLGSVICLGVATAGTGRLGARGGAVARVGFEPLGLLLFVFPFMWDAAVVGF